jgi:DNA replicative helicase MCM subunit Mcm2 (Cdc46/Mcm family)
VSLYSDCSRLFGAGFSELALGADVIVLDHVDFVKPGDRVDVVGIYRAHPIRLNAA